MDLADFGKAYHFIAARIRRAGGGRGSKHRAVSAAAKEFGIDEKTAERHYDRVRRSMRVDPMLEARESVTQQMAALSALLARAAPEAREHLALLDRAFTEEEQRKLQNVEAQFGLQLAAERLELIELRKQFKRKKRK